MLMSNLMSLVFQRDIDLSMLKSISDTATVPFFRERLGTTDVIMELNSFGEVIAYGICEDFFEPIDASVVPIT